MLKRIDISKIIYAYYKSLRSINHKGISINDAIIFILIPYFVSFYCSIYDIRINNQISNLITALSILAGFLFNLLAIIHNSLGKIKKKIKEVDSDNNSIKLTFANEIHSNISYNILIAISLLILLFILGLNLKIGSDMTSKILFDFFNFLSIFFSIHFVLTLIMILNRIYILLDKEDE